MWVIEPIENYNHTYCGADLQAILQKPHNASVKKQIYIHGGRNFFEFKEISFRYING